MSVQSYNVLQQHSFTSLNTISESLENTSDKDWLDIMLQNGTSVKECVRALV